MNHWDKMGMLRLEFEDFNKQRNFIPQVRCASVLSSL